MTNDEAIKTENSEIEEIEELEEIDKTEDSKEIIEESDIYEIGRLHKESNMMIDMKYRSSAFEEKIMTMAYAIRHDWIKNDKGCLVARLKAPYIKEKLGLKKSNTSLYRDLDNMAKSMTGRNMGVSNDKNNSFHYLSVVIESIYKNGVLDIVFNPSLTNHFLDLDKKGDYTQIDEKIIVQFRSQYSIKLYRILKSKCYVPKGVKKTGIYKIYYNLAELKLSLGVVNAELNEVRKILNEQRNPDYDKAVDASPEKMFEQWYEFRRQVIDVAVTEINEKSDIKIEYEVIRNGKGGKVSGIYFIVTKLSEVKDTDNDNEEEISVEEKNAFIEWLSELIVTPLKIKDLKAIAETSKYDKEKVIKANKAYEKQKGRVENVVGFFISAIRENYETPSGEGKKKDKNEFNNFQQNEYDYKQLEMQLLDN